MSTDNEVPNKQRGYQTNALPRQIYQLATIEKPLKTTRMEDLPLVVKEWIARQFGTCEIEPISWLVSSNHCFVVTNKKQKYFLKVLKRADALERMNREKALLTYLYESGLPVPRYLASVELSEDLACIATVWIEAKPLRYLDSNGQLGRDYMEQLGRLTHDLHDAMSEKELPLMKQKAHYGYDLEAVKDLAERLLGSRHASDLHTWLVKAKNLYESWPQIPLHGDLQDKNILLTKDGLLYLCDFEAVRKDVVLRDLFVDRILLKTTLDPALRNEYQKKICQGYGVERVIKLLPDAWAFMRADSLALQLTWLQQNGVKMLDASQKVLWEKNMANLKDEISKGIAPKKPIESEHLVPQWYFGDRAVLTGHIGFQPLIPIVKQVFGSKEIRIDSQSNTISEGHYVGVPDWQSCDWAKEGALLLLHAEEQLIEVKSKEGTIIKYDPGIVLQIKSTDTLRFLPLTKKQDISLILVQLRDKYTPEPLCRENCRVFLPIPKQPDDNWKPIGKINISSKVTVLEKMPRKTTWEDIAKEPSMSLTRIDRALSIGGQLVRDFINALPVDWRDPNADVVISVKRNELAKGWNPTPVHWHFDGTHMANRLPNGKADLRNPGQVAEQIIACCGTGAPTRFLLGDVELSEAPLDKEQNVRWQKELEVAKKKGFLKYWIAPIDTLVHFGFGSFHTGSTSTVDGWRCFLKAMRGRGDVAYGHGIERSNISWPTDNGYLPSDPCGVFPDKLT